ncbi:hypothetical protein BYT27DRAFT_6470241 [Phlegmacium glaucopus]|nr:hypothetical protein BYT27DRAFT_6470241 [Phlegmacium glaucopus]
MDSAMALVSGSTLLPSKRLCSIQSCDLHSKGGPDSLLDETAPTQSSNYVTPSATSRKKVPAVFARKRARSTAFGDEEDQLDDYVLPPHPTEEGLIEQKRRQDTVAARRHLKYKLEYLQQFEKELEQAREEKEQWRQRALMLSSLFLPVVKLPYSSSSPFTNHFLPLERSSPSLSTRTTIASFVTTFVVSSMLLNITLVIPIMLK